jgi:hypothetical protein
MASAHGESRGRSRPLIAHRKQRTHLVEGGRRNIAPGLCTLAYLALHRNPYADTRPNSRAGPAQSEHSAPEFHACSHQYS